MDNFLSELFSFVTEGMSAPVHSPEYRRAAKRYEQLEQQILEKTGFELLQRYQFSELDLLGWESEKAFYRGCASACSSCLPYCPLSPPRPPRRNAAGPR